MANALFRKGLGALRPVDELAQAIMRDLKDGDLVKVETRRPRNAERHRYYWKLLSVITDNTDHWPTPEHLHFALKMRLGLIEEIVGIDGTVHLRARSTAFSRMSEEEFAHYLDRVVKVICTEVIPGLDPDDLMKETRAA